MWLIITKVNFDHFMKKYSHDLGLGTLCELTLSSLSVCIARQINVGGEFQT